MTDELIAFLRARYGAEEHLARKAAAFPYELPSDAPWERERIIADGIGGNSQAVATHRIVAIFANPTRVLAEVDAKLRILGLHGGVDPCDPNGFRVNPPYCDTVALLALPYATHPNFRAEWGIE